MEAVMAMGGGLSVFFVVCVTFFVATLAPNEFGLKQNIISGEIEETVVRGGVHVTGPLKGFIRFPAAQLTIEFSGRSSDHPPVQTRTGADPADPNSGGQPISISCALQYRFMPESLRTVYFSFGSYEAARQRFILLAGNMVGNTAQDFIPQDFWEHRDVVATRMLLEINNTLWRQGVVVDSFQIMKVDFATSFEDSITAVQVAEQSKVVNEYEQEVQEVVQAIEVMKYENMAHIANISAGAEADAKEICAGATRDAFNLKQGMKAKKYGELRSRLGFNNEQMSEYFKMKSVQKQGKGGNVVVGVSSIGQAEQIRQ